MDSKTISDNLIILSKERALRRRRERERSWRNSNSDNLETRLREVEIRMEHAVSRLVDHLEELHHQVDVLAQRQRTTVKIIQKMVGEPSEF